MRDVEARLQEVQPAAPSEALRVRVVAAALASRQRSSAKPGSDRFAPLDSIWAWRHGLVAGLIVLTLCHLAVGPVAREWARERGWLQPTPWLENAASMAALAAAVGDTE